MIEDLKQLYPWPTEKPDVPANDHGWFTGQKALPQFCGEQTKVVVELGSWMGKSARWFLDQCPNATIICIDHWKGSREHNCDAFRGYLPTLHETFLVNMWDYRDRVIPMRMDTVEGMAVVANQGVEPDLVYVDAAHDPQSVCTDICTARTLFPRAQITGDDWTWASVREGIELAAESIDFKFEHDGRTIWWLA